MACHFRPKVCLAQVSPVASHSWAMASACALRQLQQRLCPLGLDVVEPPGQDGRTCQYLAIIHQLELHGVVNHFVAAQLEQRMIVG